MAGSGEPSMVPGRRPIVEQLTDTLAFAVARVPWYRDRRDSYARPVVSPADLAALPIIDRGTVLADPRAFASSREWPAAVSYSSSTTGGVGQPRWRSHAERLALDELLVHDAAHAAAHAAGAPDPAAEGTAERGATLVIHPYDQGPPNVSTATGRTVFAAMLVPWHFALIRDMLEHGWSSPEGRVPITTIDCFSPGLRILTEWLVQHDVDPAGLGVERLVGYGSLQPGPWRRRLATTWGATYQDLYGLSEVLMSDSAQCPLCHAYHFVLPIVPEVVDVVARTPIERGTGALVLTELHPYAQLQLLLRYWTDDLVELAKPCPLGGFGIHFRGRRSSSVVIAGAGAGGGPLVVGSVQVGAIVAEVADVAVGSIDWAPWARDVGPPRFALHLDGHEIRLEVELRFPPASFPDRAAEAVSAVRARLIEEVTGLADALAAGAVGLSVTASEPGRLTSPTKV